MCLSNLFCGNDCTWAWILFIVGILLLLENDCGGRCDCDRDRDCGRRDDDCGCGCGCR